MKTVYTLICSFFLIAGLQAQTQTLFDGDNSYGGFGGPILEFSQVNGQTVADVGGGGALVMNDFFIGGYGMGTTDATVNFQDELYDIRYGHGGFWFGYTAKQHKLIHLYSSFRIGWGDVELRQNDDKKYSDNHMTLAPELGVEVNFTDWFKMGFSGGYRYVTGLNSLPQDINNVQVLTNDDFSGVFGALTFRFGGFGDYYHSSNSNNDDYFNDNDDDDFDF